MPELRRDHFDRMRQEHQCSVSLAYGLYVCSHSSTIKNPLGRAALPRLSLSYCIP